MILFSIDKIGKIFNIKLSLFQKHKTERSRKYLKALRLTHNEIILAFYMWKEILKRESRIQNSNLIVYVASRSYSVWAERTLNIFERSSRLFGSRCERKDVCLHRRKERAELIRNLVQASDLELRLVKISFSIE